jgi:hypothetical protein
MVFSEARLQAWYWSRHLGIAPCAKVNLGDKGNGPLDTEDDEQRHCWPVLSLKLSSTIYTATGFF